jgi:putative addiction module killer protein
MHDVRARILIEARVRRLEFGNGGDTRFIGAGVEEMRIHYGPGYRVYFTRRAASLVLLLAGGDKGTQRQDIRRAIRIKRGLEDGNA